ncbi:MAG: PQQ-binding-like beta-propeller repeat protein [Candidatus Poribacteria bacterium]|nr:PQQ-binding-like beta-propeller repeat protein [Candidatus Poribacteria bacterium]
MKIGAAVSALLLAAALSVGCSDSSDAPSKTPAQKTSTPTAKSTAQPNVLPGVRATAADWPMHMRDAFRSGAAAQSGLTPPFKTDWTFKTGGRISASPIVVKGVVYVGSTDHYLYALHADKWGEKWRYLAGGEIVYAPAYVNGAVVAADMSGKLTGLDAETGAKLWERSFSQWISSPPVAADGLVWVGLHPNGIAGLNPLTGDTASQQRRQATIGGASHYSRRGELLPISPATAARPAGNWKHTSVEPVRANGFTIVAFGEGSLRAFDSAGALAWEDRVGEGFEAPPAVWGGRIYAASIDGNVYALSPGKPAAEAEPVEMVESTHSSSRTRAAPSSEAEAGPVFNVGMRVPFLENRGGWARVKDPNGKERWMAPGSWAALESAEKGALFLENRIWCKIDGRLAMPPGAERPVWSPDGRRAAFYVRSHVGSKHWRATSLWFYDSQNGDTRRAAVGSFMNPRLSWSPDSRWAAYEMYDTESPQAGASIWFVNAESGKPRRLIDGEAPAWSPTRHQIALIQRRTDADELALLNSNGTELTYPARYALKGRREDYRPHTLPAWSPDGTRLAFGTDAIYHQDGTARIGVSGVEQRSFSGYLKTAAERIYALSWSPDGTKLACAVSGHGGASADDPGSRRIVVYWADESQPGFVLPHAHPTWIDGARLAYAQSPTVPGDQTRVWVVDANARRKRLALKTHLNVSGLQWVEARKRLAVWTSKRPVKDGKLQAMETRCWFVRISDEPQY